MIQDKVTFVDNLLVVLDGRHGISGVAGGGPSRVRPNELHCSNTHTNDQCRRSVLY